eukprot:scaffold5695_cov145-Isochrysis_galbana.AAC.1
MAGEACEHNVNGGGSRAREDVMHCTNTPPEAGDAGRCGDLVATDWCGGETYLVQTGRLETGLVESSF